MKKAWIRVVLCLAALVTLATEAGPRSHAALGAGAALPSGRTVVIGHSVQGRAITARRYGDPESPRKALIVGSIHGNEPQGIRITRTIRAMRDRIHGMDVWVISTANPDGLKAHRRQNARGVDLNRNFGTGWRRTGARGSKYYAGRRAFSEPESRALRKFLLRLRPAVTVWYHQPFGYVIPPLDGGDIAVARAYARLSGYSVRTPPGRHYTGTATMWQNAHMPDSTAFVVELPAAHLSPKKIRRHARAALAVARLGKKAGGT